MVGERLGLRADRVEQLELARLAERVDPRRVRLGHAADVRADEPHDLLDGGRGAHRGRERVQLREVAGHLLGAAARDLLLLEQRGALERLPGLAGERVEVVELGRP